MACTTASGFWTQDRYPVAGEDSLVGRRLVPWGEEEKKKKKIRFESEGFNKQQVHKLPFKIKRTSMRGCLVLIEQERFIGLQP